MFSARSTRWRQILIWFLFTAWPPPGWWLVRIWASACSWTDPWRRLVRVWRSFLCLFSWRWLIRVWVMPLLDPICPWWIQWMRFFIWQKRPFPCKRIKEWLPTFVWWRISVKHKKCGLKHNTPKFRFAVYLIFLSIVLEVINLESHDGFS